MRLSLQSFDIFQNDQLVIFNYISLPLDAHFINYMLMGWYKILRHVLSGGGGAKQRFSLIYSTEFATTPPNFFGTIWFSWFWKAFFFGWGYPTPSSFKNVPESLVVEGLTYNFLRINLKCRERLFSLNEVWGYTLTVILDY